MRVVRFAAAALALALLATCGQPAQVPVPTAPAGGTPIETHLLINSWEPNMRYSILAASNLETLRAVVDATYDRYQVTGPRLCRTPYAHGRDVCWPGARSQAGHAYLAMAITYTGTCQFASRPQLYLLPGRRLLLEVRFSRRGVFCPGAAAAPLPGAHLVSAGTPTADLVSVSTTGLASGLYMVSYRSLADGGTYDSDPTYLSVPGPASASQSTVEAEAAAGLIGAGVVSGAVVSLARVAGDQVGELCGRTVSGPALLITADSGLPHRQASVVLAGPTPHVCAVTSI